MTRRSPAGPLAVLTLILAACAPTDGGATASPSASTDASASADASPAATTAATAEPIPSDELEEFTCDLPIVEDATIARANYVDIRVGEHDGYDRVVWEFAEGTPEFTLARGEPPFHSDGAGFELDVDGSSFLQLTMRNGTAQQDDGTSSYDGPRELRPDFSQLVHLVQGGDFEGQSSWYMGLNAEACVRVILLSDPDRLVIDVEH